MKTPAVSQDTYKRSFQTLEAAFIDKTADREEV